MFYRKKRSARGPADKSFKRSVDKSSNGPVDKYKFWLRSHIEAKFDNIAVLNFISFAFEPDFALLSGFGIRSGGC